MKMGWDLHGDGRTITPGEIVAPGERLSWPRTIGFGAQHVVAMFGATILVPILTGFPVTTTLLFSGVGTLLFLLLTRNRLPSYLGSSFALLAPVGAAMADGIGAALFGILASGVLLALIGLLVIRTGTGWIEALMPPVVMGAVVALIGFNLGPTAVGNFVGGDSAAPDGTAVVVATITLVTVLLVTVGFRGLLGRVSILVGAVVGYVAAAIAGVVDYSAIDDAAWFGLPDFHAPDPHWSLLPLFLPVVLVLVAENIGHVRSVALLARDERINAESGRALLADGVATTLAGLGGGSATTTYGENIGVMTATRVFSTAAYWVAGVVAILLSLSPKVGAALGTVPAPVLGGITVALYGLIGLIGIRIWIDNRVDFSQPVNQFTAAVALIVGIGNMTLTFGDLQFGGIALGTVAAIVVYHGMSVVARLRGTA